MIKVSVIIPVYNMEKYLRECLESVLAQTLKPIEVICVDDGSQDASRKILLEYAERYRNIVLFHQENQGAGLARNKGITHAKGKYLCFMDADDYYASICVLEKLYLAAEKYDVPVCGGNMVMASVSGKKVEWREQFYEDKFLKFQDYGDIFGYTRYIYSVEMIRKNNIVFPQYRRYQDPPFFLSVMAYAREFYALNELIYVVRGGYKKINYTLDMVIELLKGIRDCFKVAQENNFIITYKKYLKEMLKEYLAILYPYACQGLKEIWELIDEINKLSKEWMGEVSEIFYNKESLERYIIKLKEKREYLIKKCHMAEKVVIYGAGVAGKYFLKQYGGECKCIVGFAVSDKCNSKDFIEGYEIKKIEEYNRDMLVVVAANQKNAKEMLEKLEKMHFKDICYVEVEILRVLEEIQDKMAVTN